MFRVESCVKHDKREVDATSTSRACQMVKGLQTPSWDVCCCGDGRAIGTEIEGYERNKTGGLVSGELKKRDGVRSTSDKANQGL